MTRTIDADKLIRSLKRQEAYWRKAARDTIGETKERNAARMWSFHDAIAIVERMAKEER